MRRDEAYLLDILLYARRIRAYLAGVAWEEFKQNTLLQDAITRNVEVIGEAARQISQETRDAHPEIPWHAIVSMRNRLLHEYFRVDLIRVWDTVQNDIPTLIALIEPLVPPKDT